MSTKLTLTIDKSVIEKAKHYAKDQGRSLSNLIEDYLKSVTSEEKTQEPLELSPEIRSLMGSVKPLPGNLDYNDILAEELMKKYLK